MTQKHLFHAIHNGQILKEIWVERDTVQDAEVQAQKIAEMYHPYFKLMHVRSE